LIFDVLGFGTVRQLDLMIDLLGVNESGMADFAGAVDPARRYLRRKLSSLHGRRRAAPGSKSMLSSLLRPYHDHNMQHLVTRLIVFSPVCQFDASA